MCLAPLGPRILKGVFGFSVPETGPENNSLTAPSFDAKTGNAVTDGVEEQVSSEAEGFLNRSFSGDRSQFEA